jgi:tRNA G46 methylase TrmB
MKTASANLAKWLKERRPARRCIFLCGLLSVLLVLPLCTLAQRIEPADEHQNSIQPPGKVIDVVGVKPGMIIGEVGAGTGRFTVHLSVRVGETGRIYANDIYQPGLDHLRDRCQKDGIKNVEIILATASNVGCVSFN